MPVASTYYRPRSWEGLQPWRVYKQVWCTLLAMIAASHTPAPHRPRHSPGRKSHTRRFATKSSRSPAGIQLRPPAGPAPSPSVRRTTAPPHSRCLPRTCRIGPHALSSNHSNGTHRVPQLPSHRLIDANQRPINTTMHVLFPADGRSNQGCPGNCCPRADVRSQGPPLKHNLFRGATYSIDGIERFKIASTV